MNDELQCEFDETAILIAIKKLSEQINDLRYRVDEVLQAVRNIPRASRWLLQSPKKPRESSWSLALFCGRHRELPEHPWSRVGVFPGSILDTSPRQYQALDLEHRDFDFLVRSAHDFKALARILRSRFLLWASSLRLISECGTFNKPVTRASNFWNSLDVVMASPFSSKGNADSIPSIAPLFPRFLARV